MGKITTGTGDLIGVFYLEEVVEVIPEKALVCEKCGFKLTKKTKFCPECGGKF